MAVANDYGATPLHVAAAVDPTIADIIAAVGVP